MCSQLWQECSNGSSDACLPDMRSVQERAQPPRSAPLDVIGRFLSRSAEVRLVEAVLARRDDESKAAATSAWASSTVSTDLYDQSLLRGGERAAAASTREEALLMASRRTQF